MKNPINNTILISRKQFESMLLEQFNLKIDLDSICMYIDSYSCNEHIYSVENPNVFTIQYKDNHKHAFNISHINSQFYKEQYKENTELYHKFKVFISEHTFKYKNHYLV